MQKRYIYGPRIELEKNMLLFIYLIIISKSKVCTDFSQLGILKYQSILVWLSIFLFKFHVVFYGCILLYTIKNVYLIIIIGYSIHKSHDKNVFSLIDSFLLWSDMVKRRFSVYFVFLLSFNFLLLKFELIAFLSATDRQHKWFIIN